MVVAITTSTTFHSHGIISLQLLFPEDGLVRTEIRFRGHLQSSGLARTILANGLPKTKFFKNVVVEIYFNITFRLMCP